MASITVPEEVHRALRVRAARHGRSAEAEIRNILERAMKPAKRVRLGDALAARGRKVGLTDEDIAATDQTRDKSPVAGTLLKASASDRPWCGPENSGRKSHLPAPLTENIP
jgi:antitoxin FitA